MDVKERLRRIKKWCDEHKVELGVGVLTLVSGGLIVYGMKRKSTDLNKIISNAIAPEKLESNVIAPEKLDWVEFKREMTPVLFEGVEFTEATGELYKCFPDAKYANVLLHDNLFLATVDNVKQEDAKRAIEELIKNVNGPDDLEIWVGGTLVD